MNGPAHPGERPTWVRWQIIALLMAYSFMSWFNRVSMSAAYDERIQQQYGVSEQAIGWVFSSFFFVYFVFMTPGGWLIDRFGARSALIVMGWASALFCVLTGAVGMMAQTAGQLVVGLLIVRGLMGLFTAPIYPASARLTMDWVPVKHRAWANGLIQGSAGFGIACTYVVFGGLMDRFRPSDWPWAFLITGFVTYLVALLWTVWAKNHPAEHRHVNAAELELIRGDETPPWAKVPSAEAEKLLGERSAEPPSPEKGIALPPGVAVAPPVPDSITAPVPDSRTYDDARPLAARPLASWTTVLFNRSLICLTLSYAALGYFEYLFFFWMHYFFEGQLKMGKTESRWYSFIVNISFAVGMLLGGFLSDRFRERYGQRLGRMLVPVAGMLGGAGLLLVGLAGNHPAWIVTWFALALGCVGACEAPFWTTSVEMGGRRGGLSAAICNTGGNIGGFFAPIVTPFVSDHLGWPFGIALGGLVCLAGVCLWLWIDPSERIEPALP
jgi:ACS family glucarate transporter-like MFS transporter